jgi:histidinol-phosphatase (PHP family)
MEEPQKRDGHAHSEYSGHGSGEPTAALIERAIALGFRRYAVTEHAPLPPEFVAQLPYSQDLTATLQLDPAALDAYLADMHRLKVRYARHVQIDVGFELDYLPGFEAWTRAFLDRVGPWVDDAVLSVHFLPVHDTWRGIDLTADELQADVMPFYGGFEGFQLAYYATVDRALSADLGIYKPRRLAHLTLPRKFWRRVAPDEPDNGPRVAAAVARLLRRVREAGYALDHNLSGLDKPDCGEPYPPDPLAREARRLGIPLVYGSDAHSVAEVGRHYARHAALMDGPAFSE